MQQVHGWWFPDRETNPKVFEALRAERHLNAVRPAMDYVTRRHRAIDVGAWIGDTTRFLAAEFDWVCAFEPAPDVWECMWRNLDGRDNVEAHRVALSDRAGAAGMGSRATNSAWVDTRMKGDIPLATLDSFGFTDIDFIKIDVDSHEGYTLRGAREFFRVNRPVVCIEIKRTTHDRQPEDMPDPDAMLTSYGYVQDKQLTPIDWLYLPER